MFYTSSSGDLDRVKGMGGLIQIQGASGPQENEEVLHPNIFQQTLILWHFYLLLIFCESKPICKEGIEEEKIAHLPKVMFPIKLKHWYIYLYIPFQLMFFSILSLWIVVWTKDYTNCWVKLVKLFIVFVFSSVCSKSLGINLKSSDPISGGQLSHIKNCPSVKVRTHFLPIKIIFKSYAICSSIFKNW